MKKARNYSYTKFTPEIIQEAYDTLKKRTGHKFKHFTKSFSVVVDDSTWEHDSEDEVFSDYRRSSEYYTYRRSMRDEASWQGSSLDVTHNYPAGVRVSVQAADRGIIEAVFEIFERIV